MKKIEKFDKLIERMSMCEKCINIKIRMVWIAL